MYTVCWSTTSSVLSYSVHLYYRMLTSCFFVCLEIIMATAKLSPNSEKRAMKKKIQTISLSIDSEQYSKLRDAMSNPWEIYQEFDTAELIFTEQLLNNEFHPWNVAKCVHSLGYKTFGDDFEIFL